MSPISNKQRGKFFEEKITTFYRKLFGLSKHQCFRAGSSGARTSIELTGDITFTDPEKYPIITECKYRKTFELYDFFPICNRDVEDWIEQSERQKKLYNSHFNNINPLLLLIVGKPYLSSPWVVILNDIDRFKDSKIFHLNHLTFTNKKINKQFIVLSLDDINEVFTFWKYITTK